MLFTPNDVFAYARDRARRNPNSPIEPALQARQFNNVLRRLVGKVNNIDPERLADELVIDNTDVTASTTEIDITASGTVDWLHLGHIDWRTSSGGEYEDQVVLTTIEARHRAQNEFSYLGIPIGYLFAKMTKIKKVHGWSGVYDLRVYGTQVPQPISHRDPSNDFTEVFDYPEPLFRALQVHYLLAVAPQLSPSELELQLWISEAKDLMEELEDDARFHVGAGARVEDVPHFNTDQG